MPNDLTENNAIGMAMILADVDSNDAKTIMLMVKLFAMKKEGTATAQQVDAIETIEHLVGIGNPEQITNAN